MKLLDLIKRFFILMLVVAIPLGIFGCSDDDDDDNFSGNLSVTVNYPADNEGIELTAVIFYSMPSFDQEAPTPDLDAHYDIPDADEGNHTFTFSGITRASVYVGALMDRDDSSGPTDGDYGEFYDGNALLSGSADQVNLVNGGNVSVEITLDDADILEIP